MRSSSLQMLWSRKRIIGLTAIAVAIVTWAVDLQGLVYNCPYCRVQRSVIGLLGLLMLAAPLRHWLTRYAAAILAVFGLSVGSYQHFAGWAAIMMGEFSWGEPWYINEWILSGSALFIITGMTLLIWSWRPPRPAA